MGVAARLEGGGILRLALDRFREVGDGVVQVAAAGVGQAAVEEEAGAGAQPNCRGIVRQRLVELAQVGEREPPGPRTP